ncbi:MAG: DUF1285 domain-containing protein [Desulfobacterales bacterium]|nr:DUF1285 domain-containing protein [Desulfobacterales bacterium]
MHENQETIIIPKENAVFWLDAEGRWHNEHGPFEHPKVSAYFHTCIQRDADGYYVGQQRDAVYEKVYFRFEDTALFVFRVDIGLEAITLRLNTGQQIALEPGVLSTKNDHLYIQTSQGIARFNQSSLLEISKRMEEENGDLFIVVGRARFKVAGQL